MKRYVRIASIALSAVLWLTVSGAQGSSPFCVVFSDGSLFGCHYETLDSCQSAARGMGGACVLNPGPRPTPSGGALGAIPGLTERGQRIQMRDMLLKQQQRQPLLDCMKALGPSGLADCERLFGQQK